MTNISTALNLMKTIADEMDRDAPITLPLVFLRIAQAGAAGIDQGQLQNELKLGSSSTTRTVQSLGDMHYLKQREGLRLIERTIDPTNNRQRILRLTPKGERFIAKLIPNRGKAA